MASVIYADPAEVVWLLYAPTVILMADCGIGTLTIVTLQHWRSLRPALGEAASPGPCLRILFFCWSLPVLQPISRIVEPPTPAEGHVGPPHQVGAAEAALLTMADPGLESRITLIGPHTLELLCVLLRQGHANVLATRVTERPQVGSADTAIIPGIASSDCLGQAIAHARRVLAPLGTVAVHLVAGPADALSQQAGHLLLLHGFSVVRTAEFCGETLMRGELPLHGRLGCA